MAYIPATNQSVSGTVGASAIGLTPVSVSNLPANQSVSGAVSIGNFPANQSISGTVLVNNGSVVAFQGAGWSGSIAAVVTNTNINVSGSVVASGTVTANIGVIPGSILAFPTGNQSVSGTVNVAGTPSISGDVRIIGSVITTAVAVANQSVSGTVNLAGNPSISGTVQVGNFPTTQNVSGSVVASGTITANIGTIPGSVIAFPTGNQSVSGAVNITGNPSISGTVLVNNGSVVAFQGTSPWTTDNGNRSVIGVQQGSVAVAIVSGSIAATFTPPANQSVSGTVQTDVRGSVAAVIIGGSIATATTNSSVMLLNGPNVIGSVAALQGTNPWLTNIGGSVITVSKDSSVIAYQLAGSILATSATVNAGNSSVMLLNGANVIGSVTALQGTNPWVVNFQNSSILAVPVGSTVSYIQNSVATVIIGGSIAASFTPPANQSVSGTVGASIIGVVPASVSGTVKIFPASIVTGSGSLVGVASVQVLSAPGTTLRNYVTDIIISNTGAATTLVSITDGDGSVIGKTIAPTGGGSNIVGLASPMFGSLNQVINISAATATSVLHGWLGGYIAP